MSLPTSPTTPSAAPGPAPEQDGPQVDLLTWLELNRKPLLIGVAVVCVVVIGSMVVRHNRQQAEIAANTALLELTPPTRGADAATPPKAADLLKLADDNAGRAAAGRARFLAAGRLYAEGKHAEARAQFEQVEREAPEGFFASTSALGIAASLDAENKSAEAMASYQRVITAFKDEPAAAHAKLAKARLHEAAGQFKEALALYDEIGKGQSSMVALQSAMMARSQLLTAHPELDKPAVLTNAVNVLTPPAAK
jgi:predicted negative regulator of RcsB-dependent stress response